MSNNIRPVIAKNWVGRSAISERMWSSREPSATSAAGAASRFGGQTFRGGRGPEWSLKNLSSTVQPKVQSCACRSSKACRTNRNSPGLSATLWLIDPAFFVPRWLHHDRWGQPGAARDRPQPSSMASIRQQSSFRACLSRCGDYFQEAPPRSAAASPPPVRFSSPPPRYKPGIPSAPPRFGQSACRSGCRRWPASHRPRCQVGFAPAA